MTRSQPPVRRGGPRRRRSGRDALAIAAELRAHPELGARLTHWAELPERPARTAPLPAALHPRLRELLTARGLGELWSHQADALEAALAGRDVLVTTPTASGKTLCYTAPILQNLLDSGGRARALCLFPTKALSQDQSAGLNALIGALGDDWHSFTYDGDTPPSVRRTLRERGHVVLTNPWMLHTGILPNHAKWSDLFRELRTIVIDEVHTLSGVFGSSVANVLRRLLRICEHYGARPQFLLSSATLRDARHHARRLTGRDVHVVSLDGSPAGARAFGVYNPPVLDPVAGLRANALEEARRLAPLLCGPDHQTIFFCNRRTAVEVLTRYLKEAARELGLRPEEVRGYRGGYLPQMRRDIEAGLRSGEVKVVVSTNALELGIDVGSLDVAVLVGYPGHQAGFWQRAGRVGRRGKPSLVVMLARSDPVDQYLAAHPAHLFEAPPERLGLDPDNLVILSEQLKCAAFELPFRAAEVDGGGFGGSPDLAGVLDYLADESGFLHRRGDTWYWMADAYPAENVSLAGGEADDVILLDAETGKAVGEIDREGALTTCHEGAIYQVEGQTWKVERFDWKNRRAYLRPVETDYYTEAETDTNVSVLRLERRLARARDAVVDEGGEVVTEDVDLWLGEVHVVTRATLYKKIRYYTRESLGAGDIELPEEEVDTEACVLTLSEPSAGALGLHGGGRGAAWRGVGELLRRVAPLFLRCQPGDVGLSTQVRSTHFRRPAIVFYDRVQGGVGLSAQLFEAWPEVVRAALDVVDACECEQGCPACVGPVAQVGALGKATAREVLAHLATGRRLEPAPVPELDLDAEAAPAPPAEVEP